MMALLRLSGKEFQLLKGLSKLIIFKTFANEILPVDAVWSR